MAPLAEGSRQKARGERVQSSLLAHPENAIIGGRMSKTSAKKWLRISTLVSS